MLDTVKYEYVELDLPNIVVEWDRSKDRKDIEFEIDIPIKALMLEAAQKHPTWKFVSSGYGRRPKRNTNGEITTYVNLAYRFNVYDSREKIGDISYSSNSDGEAVFLISNDRIYKSRERGSHARTKDLKKALKIISKQFGAKTVEEHLAEAEQRCENLLSMVCREKRHSFNRDYQEIFNKTMAYMMGNWEVTKKVAMDNGVDLTLLDRLPQKYEDYQLSDEIENAYAAEEGAFVVIHGNDYAVKYQKHTTIYSTENLPAWIKRGVGMLKLVEENNLLGKVGFKVGEDKFFVIKEKTSE